MCTKAINADGRILIPSKIRKKLHIKTGDKLSIDVNQNHILIEKIVMTCLRCGRELDLIPAGDQYICKRCVKSLNRQFEKKTS